MGLEVNLSNTVRLANISLIEETKIARLSTQINFLDAHLRAIIMPRLGISLSRAGSGREVRIIEPDLQRKITILSSQNNYLALVFCSFVQYVKEHFLVRYDKVTAHFTQ